MFKILLHSLLFLLLNSVEISNARSEGTSDLKEFTNMANSNLRNIRDQQKDIGCPPERPKTSAPKPILRGPSQPNFLSGKFIQSFEKTEKSIKHNFKEGDLIFLSPGSMDWSTHVLIVEKVNMCNIPGGKKVECLCFIHMTAEGVNHSLGISNNKNKNECINYSVPNIYEYLGTKHATYRFDNKELAKDYVNSFKNMIDQDVKYSVSRAIELFGKKFTENKAGEEQKRRLLKNSFKEYTLRNLLADKNGNLSSDEKKVFIYGSRVKGKEKKEICSTSAANRLWTTGLSQNIQQSPELEKELMNTVVGKFKTGTALEPKLGEELERAFDVVAEKVLKDKDLRKILKIDSYPFTLDSNRMLPNELYNVLEKNKRN